MTADYPRDLIGYGHQRPHPKWPDGARIAVQFVLNYEEGGENCVLHGDDASEMFLSEIVNAPALEGVRHMSMESLYEFGSRVGVWRVLDLFKEFDLPLTIFGVAMALERHPAVVEAFLEAGHEIASHGYRWINYQYVDIDTEREHLHKAIDIIKRLTGAAPAGWYTGRTSPNTRQIVMQHGGFLYDADDYNDELPYWVQGPEKPHLVVPYTLDTNDMRFATVSGFNYGEPFYQYLKDSFDCLYAQGETQPAMLSIGLHCRLIGKPGRIQALRRFLRYITDHSGVWVCRREDIARHWHQHHQAGSAA